MKTKSKRIATAGLISACALTLFAGAGMLFHRQAFAEEGSGKTIAATYFYDNLVTSVNGGEQEYELAKKFYLALDEMNENGEFKDGRVVYDITEKKIVSSEQLAAWVNDGDITIPKAFGAARDAFLTDHPEVFYIDFYKLTISVGRSNGVYSGYIDTGREATAYYDGGFTSEAEVNKAIEDYNKKIDAIEKEALEAQQKDVYSAKDVYLARYVNTYLAENIKYDFDAYNGRDDKNAEISPNTYSAYGALVSGKAVCSGFARAYKVVMDRLGIPCITVNGYSNSKDANGFDAAGNVYHMWNNVWLSDPAVSEVPAAKPANALVARAAEGGAWYSVDVTWNSTAVYKNKYAILNERADGEVHVTDGVISSSKYELKYPALSSYSYGATGDTEGLHADFDYEESDRNDDYGNKLVTTWEIVSYNGKSAKKLLEEDGLHIVFRNAYYNDGKLKWTLWTDFAGFARYAELAFQNPELISDDGVESRMYSNTSVLYSQYAVVEIDPDKSEHIHSDTYGIDEDLPLYYTDQCEIEDYTMAISPVKTNKSYGTYTPAPYVISSTPNYRMEQVISDNMRDPFIKDKVVMDSRKAFEIEVTYDEVLHVIDPEKPIGISFVSKHPNTAIYAGFVPLDEKGTLVELVQRPKNSGDSTLIYNTLKFKFLPSLMYEHNREGYNFIFSNVGSAKLVTKLVNGVEQTEYSNKEPQPAHFGFGRMVIACPACFNYDGRLYIDCVAQPTLVDNSDLSAMEFKDEQGNSTFSEKERSQMMLVVNSVDETTENKMFEDIADPDKIGIKTEAIEKSETYDIKLQICGKYSKISDGSYVKIALGFPEGYGPDQAGVTFKLFHRKHLEGDNYIIEEVPCVVTQFGIVATVTSFSPYMVAAVKSDQIVSNTKTIYATVAGNGGKLSREDGMVQSLKQGESYSFTISPDKGYQLYTVTLNGKDVTSKVENGKLAVKYEELAFNNELEVKYIADGAVKRVVENNLISPVKVVADGDQIVKVGDVIETPDYLEIVTEPNPAGDVENDGGSWVIAVCVIAAVVAITGIATAVAFVVIKKKNNR